MTAQPKFAVEKNQERDPKIAHESEIQRQHVRVEVPASAKLGDKVYKIKDLSAGGFSVYAPEKVDIFSAGKIKIVFPFPGYALQVEARAELVADSRELKTAGFRFVEIDSSQISLLNHIIKTRMTGSLPDAGELLGVAGRNNFVELKPRAPAEKKGFAAAFRRILPTIFMSFLGLAALSLFAGNVYENSSILKSYQGVVEGGSITIRARTEGNVRLLVADEAEKVTKGQQIAAIQKDDAQESETQILSPCDCYIQQRQVQNGEFKTLGEPLFTLVQQDARPWVSMLVDPEKAHHLRLQDDVNVRIAGEGGFIAGHIMEISAEGLLDKPYTKVKIRPEKTIALDMLGRPAYAEFPIYK